MYSWTIRALFLVLLGYSAVCAAQNSTKMSANDTPIPRDVPTARLEFDKPIMVSNLTVGSGIAGVIACSDEGNILFLLDMSDPGTDANGHPLGHVSLVAVTPKGEMIRYAGQSVPGYQRISTPESYFGANGKVYALVYGEKQSLTAEQQKHISVPLVLVYDDKAMLTDVVPIDPTIDPISIGAFANGDLLVLSEDEFNQRMRLTILDSTGGASRELRLFDSDAMAHEGASASSAKGKLTYSPDTLAHFTEIHPYGQDLLLVPANTSGLPIVEINENGIVRSITPQLPEKSILSRWLDADDLTWHIYPGKVHGKPQTDMQSGKVSGVASIGSNQIDEINPNDGSVTRTILIPPGGVLPACEHGGDYLFVTSHMHDGLLELVKGTPR